MKKINSVIDGDFAGRDIVSVFGSVSISTSTFGTEDINIKNVEHISIVDEKQTEKDISYELKVEFKSGKKSLYCFA